MKLLPADLRDHSPYTAGKPHLNTHTIWKEVAGARLLTPGTFQLMRNSIFRVSHLSACRFKDNLSIRGLLAVLFSLVSDHPDMYIGVNYHPMGRTASFVVVP